MSIGLRAAGGILGSLLVLIALVITFIKQLISFIGFLTFALKIGIFVVFVALIAGVGLLILRSWKANKPSKE